MGQQNQKVVFEESHKQSKSRRQIFIKGQAQTEEYYCEVPNCQCNMPHRKVQNQKVCSGCLPQKHNQPHAFRRYSRVPEYIKNDGSERLKKPQKATFSSDMNYVEVEYRQNEPTRIDFYNAWSLPVQRCYVNEKNDYETTEASVAEDFQKRIPKYEEDIQPSFSMNMLTKPKVDENQFRGSYNNRERKQNMNFY